MKFVAMCCFLFFFPSIVGAVLPTTTYQGVLVDADGETISGDHDLIFSLYDSQDLDATVLWSESHTGVQVQDGVFQVVLGNQSALTPGVLDSDELWIGVAVDDGEEISPRAPLSAVPWAIRAAVADSVASGSSSSVGDGHSLDAADGEPVDAVYVDDLGRVGIGTHTPAEQLEIDGNIRLSAAAGEYGAGRLQTVSPGDVVGLSLVSGPRTWDLVSVVSSEPDYFSIRDNTVGVSRLLIDANGNVEIGRNLELTTAPGEYGAGRIQAVSSGDVVGLSLISGPRTWDLVSVVSSEPDYFSIRDNTVGASRLLIDSDGNVGIGISRPARKLDVAGTTRTAVLEITGGSDIAEPFEMVGGDLPPGSVVVIDRHHPGKLSVSTQPYDRAVAGIISGAGGVKPGMSLSQEGVLDEGQHVALAGRVYARACADNGSIEPGDRLTTSSRPGVLMRATDPGKTPGAVVGKAMSALETGEGLVLVLIQAQ